ncbi:MAG: hypothetical protein ABJ308_08735 [Halieaceae bacterium]
MTEHALMQDTQEDIDTMRNLRNFVGLFIGFSVFMALGVAFFAP